MKKNEEKHEDDKYLYLLYEKKDEDYWKRYWKDLYLTWKYLVPIALAVIFYLLVEFFKWLQ